MVPGQLIRSAKSSNNVGGEPPESQLAKMSDQVIKKGEVILPSSLAKTGAEGDKISQNY